MEVGLIAPCGMNCGICKAHLRQKTSCPGCRYSIPGTSTFRDRCVVKNCGNIRSSASGFCYECETFPCRRVQQLEKRYTTKYRMSMMENLLMIRDRGMAALLAREEEKWRCPACGGTVSCHDGTCYTCGAVRYP